MYMNYSDAVLDAIVRDRFADGAIEGISLSKNTEAANMKGIIDNDQRVHSYIGTPL